MTKHLPPELQRIADAHDEANLNSDPVTYVYEFMHQGTSVALFEPATPLPIPAEGQIIELHSHLVKVTRVRVAYESAGPGAEAAAAVAVEVEPAAEPSVTPLTEEQVEDAVALAAFLDTRYGEDIAGLPDGSLGRRAAVGYRVIVTQARVDLTNQDHPPLLHWRAVTTLRDLGRRWAGNLDGTGRDPRYQTTWLPDGFPRAPAE
ncbi:hypothetical protein ACIGZH_01725 [Streptomyces sp. NPDC058319]|uniref:hypothetical protein n=1 Tax=unclassified Streptomyces TaxID=2593676 RepID=UPI0036EEA3F0